jgi:predicted SAM-dependent methyltransferase
MFSTDWPPNVLLHDLIKRFPWPDRSVDVVDSSRTLEQLEKGIGERFIAESRRVLKPGGILRIVVPDLQRIVKEYESGQIESRDFLVALGAHAPWAGNGKVRQIAALFSGSQHLYMYDEEALIRLMRVHGFDCHRAAPFDSAIEDIRVIEREDRAVG